MGLPLLRSTLGSPTVPSCNFEFDVGVSAPGRVLIDERFIPAGGHFSADSSTYHPKRLPKSPLFTDVGPAVKSWAGLRGAFTNPTVRRSLRGPSHRRRLWLVRGA